jgi:ABC-type nickel/cobalt efflux system permease component RcnA
MSELWTSLVTLLQSAGLVAAELGRLLFHWSLALFAVAWVGFAVDWRKFWPTLREGAAIPLTLLALMVAFAWGFLAPSEAHFLGANVPNYLWQLMATVVLLGVGFFCGWLQMRYGWFPPEIVVEPPAHHDHGHGHDDHHGHDTHEHAASHDGDTIADEDDGEPAEPPPVPAATNTHSH